MKVYVNERTQQILLILSCLNTAILFATCGIVAFVFLAIKYGW